jgi:hypothetical protein
MLAQPMSTLPSTALVVGVTGHRSLRPSDLPILEQQVRDVLRNLQTRYPRLPLVVVSPLAAGSDQLVARVALEMGIRVIAPLPLPVALYRDDFPSEEARAEFERQCDQVEVHVLPLSRGNCVASISVPGSARDRQYAEAGIFTSNHCHFLLALWDGEPSGQLGGTAQIVRFHLHGDMPGQIERRRDSSSLLGLEDDALVCHIRAPRTGSRIAPGTGPSWLTSAEAPGSARLPEAFDQAWRKQSIFNADIARHCADLAASAEKPGPVGPGGIWPLFEAADALARLHQRRVNRALRATYLLAALMGVAFFSYTHVASEDLVIYAFLAVFLTGMAVTWLARRGDWQRKYLDYRALAEGLRVQAYWQWAGLAEGPSATFAHDNFLQKQDAGLEWIRNVMRAVGLESALAPTPEQASRIDVVIAEWIGAPGEAGQLHYYVKAMERRERLHRRAELFGLCCIVLGVGVSVLLALFARRFDGDLKHNLVAVMGILSVVAAVHEAYMHKKADKELIKQYAFMQRIFAAARRRIGQSHSVHEKRQVLRALGEAALTEHAEWTLMHRERPVQHSRI